MRSEKTSVRLATWITCGAGRTETEPIVPVAVDGNCPPRGDVTEITVPVREVEVPPRELITRELSEVIIVFE